jgi:hypothetical protein
MTIILPLERFACEIRSRASGPMSSSSFRCPSRSRINLALPAVSTFKLSGASAFIDEAVSKGEHIGVSAITIVEIVYLMEKGCPHCLNSTVPA